MMEAARTSESLVNFYQATRRYNQEDSHLRTHRRENLKSQPLSIVLSSLQSGDGKKVSLSSLLEASAKGKERFNQRILFYICGSLKKYGTEANTVTLWQGGYVLLVHFEVCIPSAHSGTLC
jgi:hypothetical protein